MKILELLNKNIFLIILFILLSQQTSYGEEKPVDIWNIDSKEIEKNVDEELVNSQNGMIEEEVSESDIYKMQLQKNSNKIKLEEDLDSSTIKIVGLYDPEDYGLNLNMWINSNGDQLKGILLKLNKMDLSEDAKEIMRISLLTNAYNPNKNITNEEFLKLKSEWLIKNSNTDLIEKYLIKNQIINLHSNLTKYVVDKHLSNSNLEKACEIFIKNKQPINDDYLSKFNIYCLFNNEKQDEALLILDLKKELGFDDDYFEKKMDILFGFENKIDENISQKSVLDFHLAHRINPNFVFEPNDKTDDIIWNYLSSANLLYKVDEIEVNDFEKISLIEKATHSKNYPEKDLFELYKKFQFNINQLLNANEFFKSLNKIEARALIYQKILLDSEPVKRLELMKILKDLFIEENLSGAFDKELQNLLELIELEKIPSNFTDFYETYTKKDQKLSKEIKFNNNIFHQSKLVNYFNGDYAKSKIEKDVNTFLKKIKKDKKYILSKKDIIFIESLKSDGIEISKKFDELYVIDESEMPTDIQVMINNKEAGLALLRIAEVIGQDTLDIIDDDTMYFIISALNQLNADTIRNKILLKVLPLKV
tara:strand:- start:6150 stop:7925 length:1776 start_codon:yes stop_codon:yes gene_type:complete